MTIVCAIDGSRYSQWTLDWLQRIHAHRNGSLLLVHAADLTQFKTFSKLNQKSRSALVKVLDVSLEAAARLLESAELKAAKTWDHVRAKLLRGRPAEAIAHSARRERADLLMLGSRSGRSAREYFMGSIVDTVVKYAPCSELVHRG